MDDYSKGDLSEDAGELPEILSEFNLGRIRVDLLQLFEAGRAYDEDRLNGEYKHFDNYSLSNSITDYMSLPHSSSLRREFRHSDILRYSSLFRLPRKRM